MNRIAIIDDSDINLTLLSALVNKLGDCEPLFFKESHDIGKIGIPDYILLKPATLTPEEFAVMKTHATLGFEVLKGSESTIFQAAASIAISHHERFDGSGYPL